MPSSFEAELEALIQEHADAMKKSKHSDASDVIDRVRVSQMLTRCLAAIERASGRGSIYFGQAKAVLESKGHHWEHLAQQIGIAQSLVHNIKNGYLKTIEELLHGEVFGDFLEMAQHLLDFGYKDAAAVIAGSTLEAHVKQLCKKCSIPDEIGGKAKKADTLNSELAAAAAYSKLDQKNVTAWLGLRNSAAHGEYNNYDNAQVSLLVASIRDFLTRVPA